MASEFPKLEKHLDELLWEFEQVLQKMCDQYGLEDVELSFTVENFVQRSSLSKVAYPLREILERDLYEVNQKTQKNQIDSRSGKPIVDPQKIKEDHIAAAQGLLKIGRYQETAIYVLTQALLLPSGTKVQQLAAEALAKCGSEIKAFDRARQKDKNLFLVDGDFCKKSDGSPGVVVDGDCI